MLAETLRECSCVFADFAAICRYLPKFFVKIRMVSLLFVRSFRTSFHRSSRMAMTSKALNSAELFLCEPRVSRASPALFAVVYESN